MATERTTRTRKTRTPIGDMSRSRLRVDGKDPDFEYYIVNDIDGRIDMMKEAGWEVVTESNVKIGDRRVTNPNSQEGSAKTVSVGGGVTGVLMKIPKEWWEEDQKRKQDTSAAIVKDTMSEAKKSSDYGDIKLS